MHISAPEIAGGPEYVLVIVDGFSRFVWLVPFAAANAANCAGALAQWFALFGVVRGWVSDQGRHFQNQLLTELAYRLGAEHRFTAAYAPWSNGLVERVNLELRVSLSSICSCTGLASSKWPDVLPLVNAILNSAPSSALGGHSPMEVFLGRKPTSPLDVVFSPGTPVTFVAPSAEVIENHVSRLRTELSELTSAVIGLRPRPVPMRSGETPMDFDIGDFVLVARSRKRASDKAAPIWNGPALVVKAVNDRTFTIRDLSSGLERDVHAEYLKRYADKSLTVTPQLRKFAAEASVYLEVHEIAGHRQRGGQWELKVLWKGFDLEDSTWERLESLFSDVPETVQAYVRAVQDELERASMTTAMEALSSSL